MPEWLVGTSLIINFLITYNILKKRDDINEDNIAIALIFGMFAVALTTVLLNSMTNLVIKNILLHIIVCIVFVKVLKS